MSSLLREKLIVPLLCKITPPCDEVTRLLSQSMELPLPLWRRGQLRLHFHICCWCQRYGLQIRLLRKFLRRLHEHLGGIANLGLSEASKQKIRTAMEKSGG